MQDELTRLQEAAAEADREYKDALWEDDDDVCAGTSARSGSASPQFCAREPLSLWLR